MNAINDALRPLGAKPLTEMPFTPERILRALERISIALNERTRCSSCDARRDDA